jgi:hypothetical protein
MSKISDPLTFAVQRDWARRPLTILVWWCLPIAFGMSATPLRLTAREAGSVWAVSFAWMATGCLLNARRCHRLHCYLSGPVLLAGATIAALVASGSLQFGPSALSYAICGTFALAILSFVPEAIWRKYI